MTSRCRSVVCLIVPCFLYPAEAVAQREPTLVRTPLANIYVSRSLARSFSSLLEKSPTVRQQCDAIAGARSMHVVLRVTAGPPRAFVRAQTTMRRYSSGLVIAVVDIPAGDEYVELIAHELEHIVEQVEGVDLEALANEGSADVTLIKEDIYETARAQEAGRAAVQEVYGPADPALGAIRRALTRAARQTRDMFRGN